MKLLVVDHGKGKTVDGYRCGVRWYAWYLGRKIKTGEMSTIVSGQGLKWMDVIKNIHEDLGDMIDKDKGWEEFEIIELTPSYIVDTR